MSKRTLTLLFGALAIGAIALKFFGPEDASTHFEKMRGKTDIEKLKAQAADYDRRRQEQAAGGNPAATSALSPTPVLATTPAPVANSAPPTSSPSPSPSPTPSASPTPGPQANATSGTGTTLYLRFADRVLRMRLTSDLTDNEKAQLDRLLPDSCIITAADKSSATDADCKVQIEVDGDQPSDQMRLACSDGQQTCLTEVPVHLKVTAASDSRAIASEVAVYAPQVRDAPSRLKKKKVRIYRMNPA